MLDHPFATVGWVSKVNGPAVPFNGMGVTAALALVTTMHTNAAAKREKNSSAVVISDPPGLDFCPRHPCAPRKNAPFRAAIPWQSLGVGTQGASRKLKIINLARKCKANFATFCANT